MITLKIGTSIDTIHVNFGIKFTEMIKTLKYLFLENFSIALLIIFCPKSCQNITATEFLL